MAPRVLGSFSMWSHLSSVKHNSLHCTKNSYLKIYTIWDFKTSSINIYALLRLMVNIGRRGTLQRPGGKSINNYCTKNSLFFRLQKSSILFLARDTKFKQKRCRMFFIQPANCCQSSFVLERRIPSRVIWCKNFLYHRLMANISFFFFFPSFSPFLFNTGETVLQNKGIVCSFK